MVFTYKYSTCLLPLFFVTGLIIINALNYDKYELNTYHKQLKSKEFHCPLNYFKCINTTQCILIIELCDGILNCLDGSDEQAFCESDMCRSSTCRYGCQPSPNGPLCYCPEGSTYNGTHCLDIKIPSSFLLYTTYKPFSIKGIELPVEDTHPSEIILPIYTSGQVSAIAFDIKNNNIYYCDTMDQTIYRQNLKSSRKEVFLEGISECSGLAIDQMGETIYWSDSNIGSISVASLYNSSVQKNLFQLKGAKPKNIIHTMGFIFWIDKNKIKMAAMDGSNEFVLVEAENEVFSSLILFNYNLYWFNSESKQIEGINVNRIKQRVVIEKLNMNIKSMTMTNNYVYWTEVSTGILHMKNLKNTSEHSSFFLENFPIYITYVHTSNRILSKNVSEDCVNCDLCLPMPYSQVQKFKCICKEGFHFDNETKKCKVSLSNKCGSEDYQCADGTCIPKIFICDGQQDCIDDDFEEKNCKTSCLYPHHSCDNGTKCINRQQICDGKYDCNDKSDEVERCLSIQTITGKCKHNNFCEEECFDTVSGPQCGCSQGKYLNIDNKTCTDIPPCKQWGRCSQICHTYNTSYACGCKWGYTLSSDKFTCISKDPSKATLLLTTESEIIKYFLHNNSQITVLSGYSRITHVDYYHTSMADLLFWVDVDKQKIFRGVLKDSAVESIHIIVEDGLGVIEGICVDWIGHNLYWLDSEYHHIEVAKFDGSLRASLIDGILRPKSIAVDSHVGFLFWADRSENGSVIERSLTNGYERHIIIHCAQNGWPTGITLDITTQYIYWVDSRLHSIYVADYHGNNLRRLLQDENFPMYFSIAVHENNIYWTERQKHFVEKVDRWKFKETDFLTATYQDIYDVRILHSSHQPPAKRNPCSHKNGYCSHLCLLANNLSITCACSYGWKLNKDGKSCSEYNNSFIYIKSEENYEVIYFVQKQNLNHFIYPPVKIKLDHTDNIIYDPKIEQFFWSHRNLLKTMQRDGRQIETILQLAHMEIKSLALDFNSDNVYMLTTASLTEEYFISVCTKTGAYFSHLIYFKQVIPLFLAVDSLNRLLFWSQIVKRENETSLYTIESSFLDGSKQKTILKFNHTYVMENNYNIYLQPGLRKLCWTDITLGNLLCTSYSGRSIKYITEMAPSSITSGHDFLVYILNEQVFEVSKNNDSKIIGNIRGNIIYMTTVEPVLSENKHLLPDIRCESIAIPLFDHIFCMPEIDGRNFLTFSRNGILEGIQSIEDNKNINLFPVKLFDMSLHDDFDIDVKNETIYWTDNNAGGIFSIKRDGTHKHLIVSFEGEVNQISIDWMSGYIYWISIKDSCIWLADSEGKYKYVVVQGNLQHPSAIAVDPVHGYLFWSDSGSQSRIERSLLSGSQRKVLFSLDLLHVSSITVDHEENTIYWSDSTSGIIERSNLDGSNRQIILSQKHGIISFPISVAVNRNYIFFADRSFKDGSIIQVNKNNFSDFDILKQNYGRNIGKLRSFDKRLQQGSNICMYGGSCDQLCLFEGDNKYTCACSYSKLGTDQHSCLDYTQLMLMAEKSTIMALSLDDPNSLNPPVPSIEVGHNIENIIALGYDRYQKEIFFSDLYEPPYLFSIKLDGTGLRPLLKDKIGRCIEGITYDQIHGELYWTDSDTPSICRLRVEQRGEIQRQPFEAENILLLDNDDKPRGITLDSCNLYLFWTNWREDSPKIERSYFSGAQREVIVSENIIRPNGLALDLSSETLFWADAKLPDGYVIWNCDIDGSRRKIISEGAGHHPFDIVIHGSFLYWTDWETGALLQTEKLSGKGPAIIRSNLQQPMGLFAESSTIMKCMSVVTEIGSRTSFPTSDCYDFCFNGGICNPQKENNKKHCLCAENITNQCEVAAPSRSYSNSTEIATFSVILIIISIILVLIFIMIGITLYQRRQCQNLHPFFSLPFIKRYAHPYTGNCTTNMTRESSFCNGSCEEEFSLTNPLFDSYHSNKFQDEIFKITVPYKDAAYINEINV